MGSDPDRTEVKCSRELGTIKGTLHKGSAIVLAIVNQVIGTSEEARRRHSHCCMKSAFWNVQLRFAMGSSFEASSRQRHLVYLSIRCAFPIPT